MTLGMNIQKVKKKLKELNLTYEEFSKICDVPTDTLKNILSGRTKEPRQLTSNAILEALDNTTQMNERVSEIKKHLKANKITYKELSEKTNISEGTLKNIFSGFTKNPRIDTIQKIEKAIDFNSSQSNSGDKYSLKEKELIVLYRKLLPHDQDIAFKILNVIFDSNSN